MTFGKFLIRALSGFEMAPPVVGATSGAPLETKPAGRGTPVRENPDQTSRIEKWWWSRPLWRLTPKSVYTRLENKRGFYSLTGLLLPRPQVAAKLLGFWFLWAMLLLFLHL